MAVQRVGIQFDFNANTRQAQTNLNALEKTMASLETRMQKMGAHRADEVGRSAKARTTTATNLEQFGASTIDLKTPIRQTEILTDNIRKGKIGWGEYGRAVKQNSAIVTQQLAMQTGSIENVTRAGKGFQATFRPNHMLTGVSGVEFATARMNAFGESTKAVSQNIIDMGKNLAFSARQMTVSLTMPMAIVGGLAIKQFTDIDKQLTDIAKVYDSHADGVEMSTGRIRASMKDLARELSRTQGAEIKDTLDIAQYYAQQGKTGDELRQSTVQASRLMTLGDVDINDAQKTITTLTAVVGANVEELGKYVDYLNKVEDSTQLTMQDFAQTLPTIAPLVKTFIPDDKDALMATSASMMEASRRAGFEPKESMNAWKSMYGSFVRPAEKTEEVFGELTGKYGNKQSLTDVVSDRGGDPVQILTELSNITRDWNTEDRGRLMTQLTGKWQLSRGLGIMQAMDDSNPNNAVALERMSGINKELVNNPEQLADNSKRQMDLIRNSAHTQLQQLKQDAQMMFADLGENIFIPVMESLGNVLNLAKSTYEAISNLPGPIKSLLSIGAQLTFVAGPVLAAAAAVKMLGGFAGRLVGSFASMASSATRIGASMLGVKMQGRGKLESKEESIGKIQEKSQSLLGLQMKDIIEAENEARAKSVALETERNNKTREAITLQRELNRAITGTPTPTGSPMKDPEKSLKSYQASLTSTTRQWPMAIQAKNIGPESFRKHAGRIGAPATRVPGVGLEGNKVFTSIPVDPKSDKKRPPVRLIPTTDAVRAGVSSDVRQYIQKEMDKINAGIATRRSFGHRTSAEINADLKRLDVQEEMVRRGNTEPSGRRKGPERTADIQKQRSNITEQQRKLMGSFTYGGKIAGANSLSIDQLEQQRAKLLAALNGSTLRQTQVVNDMQAARKAELDATKKNAKAVETEAKNRTIGQKIRDGLSGKIGRDSQAMDNRKKAWEVNSLRGTGEYFQGHVTPKDVYNTQNSPLMKQFRKQMRKNPETLDLGEFVDYAEKERNAVYDRTAGEYKLANPGDSMGAAKAGQAAVEAANLPTEAAIRREAEMHMNRMVDRSETLEKRQQAIAENSERWASNISNAAVGIGLFGTMATSALGIQNGLVDGALMLANGVGALGMIAPDLMESMVGSFAGFGTKIADRFDSSKLGTKLGSKLGDTMGTSTAGRMSKAFSGMGAMAMTAMPYIAGIAAGMLAIKGAWDWHRKDTKEYVENLKKANDSASLHAELLGYVRKEQEGVNDLSYKEATDIRVENLRKEIDGRGRYIKEMSNVTSDGGGRVANLSAILNKEAIRIIDDGGGEADVRSMVDASLQAAGITDPKIIEGVKLRFENFDVSVDAAAPDQLMNQIKDSLSDGGRTFGDRVDDLIDPKNFKSTWKSFGESALGSLNPAFRVVTGAREVMNDEEELEYAKTNLSESAKADAEGWASDLAIAINNAPTDEIKAAIAKKWIDTSRAAREQAEASGSNEAIGANIAQRDIIFGEALKNIEGDGVAAAAALDDTYAKLRDNERVLQGVLGGANQESFNTPEKAAKSYADALAEIEGVHGKLNDDEKRALHNVFAYAGGMELLGDDVANVTDALGKYNRVKQEASIPVEQRGMTAPQVIKFLLEPEEDQLEAKRRRVEDLSETLKNAPADFHKRWVFDVDVTDQEQIDQLFSNLKSATQKGQQFAADEASRQFKDRQDAAFEQIQAESDAAMDSMDAKQKASEKAFEARGKALDAQFKNETKALDKQHKEEQKVYDKQQKERDKEFNKRQRDDQRAYDKQEKAQTKAFDKQQEKERENFDESWDSKADAIGGYYDNAIKAIDNQGKAEEKLEQLRQRNAERERKRREFLANMANTNIDINVAVAGGNLDEAARLANTAASASTDYYQDQINTEAGYDLQDRNEARGNKVDSLNEGRGAAMDEFGRLREDATEGFEDKQTLAQEKREEELQLARDVYEEKKALEAEQYEEQKALEAERFAERQALEKERLQAEQEARREALEAEKAALADRHAAEREMIQETARQKEDGARRHFEATQRSLDMEMEALLADIPIGVAAREQWVKDVEAAYGRHGVYLSQDFAPKVNAGMSKAMVNAMDTASNQMASDAAWTNIGLEIGSHLRDGALKGFTAEQVAANMVFGTKLGTAQNTPAVAAGGTGDFRDRYQGPRVPKRADGGPIFGPGTAKSDSILARLSNGEHVLTAEEVKNLGGHKAVERLRNQVRSGNVPAFADGGGIGASPGQADSSLNVRVASTGSGTVADGGVLAAVTKDVANMGSQFDSTLTNTVAPAWQMFGDTMVKVKEDSIDPVLEGSKIALDEYAAHTNMVMSANMNPAWVQFGQNLKMVKDTVWDVVMTDMKAGMTTLSNSISTAIGNEIMPKWTEGSNHIRTMQDSVIAPAMQATRDATTQTAQNFGTAADMIGVGWGRVKENSAEPVRYTIGTVFNEGLVGMWNNVADALDLEKMTPHALKFATGGVMPGYTPGRDVHKFVSPTGGQLHLSGGEAIMRPEWTRAVGGPAAVEKMNSAARSGRLSPARQAENEKIRQSHALGGVMRFARGGVVEAMEEIVGQKYPMLVPAFSSYRNTPDNHGRGLAADFSNGMDNTPAQDSLARDIAETYPGSMELIYEAPGFDKQIKNGQYVGAGGGSFGFYAGAGNHRNHVHWAMDTPPNMPFGGGVFVGGSSGLGSVGGMDPKIMAAVNKFNEGKDALKKDIEKHIAGGPDTIMKAIPGKIFTGLSEGMQKKIQEKMPMAGLTSMGAYGLNHEDHVREIIAAAKERGLTRQAAKIGVATALVESELRMYANQSVPESLSYPHEAIGSDHDSVGLFQQRNNGAWGTTAERMNARASAGMFFNALMRVPGWETMDPGAAAQAVQVSAFPGKYATRMAEADALIERVGGFDSVEGTPGKLAKPADPNKPIDRNDPSNWFDRGGIASGVGTMTKGVIAPERVLSPRQTVAFENLVPAINRVAEGGIGESEYMGKLDFDRNAAFQKMIERDSQAKIDFSGALEKITPILTQLTGNLKSQIIPGITGYATDLIQLDNDSERIDKVATDVVNAITGMKIPEINTDMAFNIGGNIYGDAQLNAILEEHRRRIIAEVQAIQAMAQQQIGGK